MVDTSDDVEDVGMEDEAARLYRAAYAVASGRSHLVNSGQPARPRGPAASPSTSGA
ncbi:MAG TPA: hypothetical protein VGH33_22305 [Isosphaeraceae bacterium]